MSDTELRRVERRWRETCCVVDEIAYLSARMTAGLLRRETLELARHCGHEASARVLGQAFVLPARIADVRSWSDGFRQWGGEAYVRMGVALAKAVLPLWENDEAREQAVRAIDAIGTFLSDPCSSHEARAAEAQRRAGERSVHNGFQLALARLPLEDVVATVAREIVPWALEHERSFQDSNVATYLAARGPRTWSRPE